MTHPQHQIKAHAEQIHKGPLNEIIDFDFDFFAVPTVWYNKWLKHTEGGPYPGPLDNSTLLDPDINLPRSRYNVFSGDVDWSLESPRDYLVWSAPVAEYFYKVYGGDKPFEVKRDFGGYWTGNVYSERQVSIRRHHALRNHHLNKIELNEGGSGWDATSTPKGHFTFIYNGTKRYVRPIEPVKNSTCWQCWEMPKEWAANKTKSISNVPEWDIDSGYIELKRFALEKMDDFKFCPVNCRVIDSPVGYDNTFLVEIVKSTRPTQKTWSLKRLPLYETAPDKEVFQIEAVDIDNDEWHELKRVKEEMRALKWEKRKSDEMVVTLQRKLVSALSQVE